MAEPAIPIDDPNRELPRRTVAAHESEPARHPRLVVTPDVESLGNSRLNETAEVIGSAMGSAVEEVRHLPERLQAMKERFRVVRDRTREQTAGKTAELKEAAQKRAREARHRAAHYAREYPLHVIAGAAAAGFLLGVVLRIWRSTRG